MILNGVKSMDNYTCFRFIRPGLQATVQDKGRYGYQHLGVPQGGVLDKSSAKIANWLVGNDDYNPVLEIALMGPTIEITGKCQIALTGADMSATIDGKAIGMYKSIKVKSGSVLSFAKLICGCRTYLSIGGTWDIKPWLSSFSASVSNIEELTPGSIMNKDNFLKVKINKFIPKRKFPKSERPAFKSSLEIRVLKGPEHNEFPTAFIKTFYNQFYQITEQFNRMGCRLKGKNNGYREPQEIISSAAIPGTIQITNSGQPIILLNDAPTTGGYPRIANVISKDSDKLAQLKTGDKIKFILVTLEDIWES
jgi:biotin-dependent carboxylase-like uncharacterized protein